MNMKKGVIQVTDKSLKHSLFLTFSLIFLTIFDILIIFSMIIDIQKFNYLPFYFKEDKNEN